MKAPPSDPQALLENIDWLISNDGEISLGAFGPAQCAAVATDESGCLAMLHGIDSQSRYALFARLDAAIARAGEEDELTDEINPAH